MLGFALALTASFLISGKDIYSKKLSVSVPSAVSAFASFAYPLPLYALLLGALWIAGVPIFHVGPDFWKYAIARAITDTGAEWCKMKALAYGELSVVTSFFALYPILLLLSSPILTGDPLEPKTPLATFIIVLGTLVILYRPRGAAPIKWQAIALALLAAVFFSLNTALDRATVQQAHPVYSAFIMTAVSALLLTSTLRRGVVNDLIQYRSLFAGRGVLEVLFMVIKLSALTMLSAPMVVGIGRLSIVLNVVAGRVIFGEQQFGRRLAGALLVSGGVIYLLL